MMSREEKMVIVSAPWGYLNLPPICDISQAIVIRIDGPVCPVRPQRS
jgi:hypothetical protein